MSSAKQLSKSYNAETAWSSLGTPKGWQEYYDMSSHVPKYQRIFRSFETDFRPPRSSSYDYSSQEPYSYDSAKVMLNNMPKGSNSFVHPLTLTANMLQSVSTYPQRALAGGLAGKYVDLF